MEARQDEKAQYKRFLRCKHKLIVFTDVLNVCIGIKNHQYILRYEIGTCIIKDREKFNK